MKKIYAFFLVFLFIGASVASAQISVTIVACPGSSAWGTEVQNKLIATGRFASVGYFNCQSTAPTLAYLQQYQAVLCFTDYGAPSSVGPVLAQFVEGGGGVVTATFADCSIPFSGFNNLSNYQVLVPTGQTQGTELTLGTVLLPNHPIMQGVTSFDGGSSSYHSTSTTLNPNAYRIANYSNGAPLVCARENVGARNSRLVDLNFYPPSTDSRSDFWKTTTSGVTLMANSLIWVATYPYDFSADSVINPANQTIKNINTALTPSVSITNVGSQTPASVTVHFQISPIGQASIYSHDTVLTGASVPSPFTRQILSFPSFTPTAYGVYEDTVIVYNMQPTADQNPSNNVTTSEFAVSPPNNVRPLTILSPSAGVRTPIAISTPVSVRFKNVGTNNQSNVPVTAIIKDPSGAVVYRDTLIIPNWPSGATIDTSFPDWTPASNGDFTMCAITLLSNDQLHADDTICGTISVRFAYDAAANSIVNPLPDEEKPYKTSWRPAALFQSVGVSDLFDVPVRVVIRRCSDGAVVFQADSTMPELNIDQKLVQFNFPTDAGPYHISAIPPG